MKTKRFALLYFVLFTELSFSQDHLSVELRLENRSVFYKEAIFLEIAVKNNSINAIMIDRPSIGQGTIKLTILDSDGKELPYYGPREITARKSQISVAANDEYSHLYDLSFLYGNEAGLGYRMYSFKPGEYTIQANYRNSGEIFKSSRITLSVKQPEGDEKEALQIYTEACQNSDSREKAPGEAALASFDNLIKKFPNSRYTPGAIARAASICKIIQRDKAKASRYYYQLIDQHIKSGYAVDALVSMKKEIQKRPDKEQFLQKALERADSRSSAHYIKDYISKMKGEIMK